MSTRTTLPLPSFPSWKFDPANAERWGYQPNHRALCETAQEYRDANAIKPAALDQDQIHLLLIDLQRDFCFPEGSLYVGGRSGRGAIEDNKRISEFIYRNLDLISQITTTLDTHTAYQIFTPSFWVDEKGNLLHPHDMVTGDLTILRGGVGAGKALPNPVVAGFLTKGDYARLVRYAREYCAALEASGKYQLYIWPEHCIIGSEGHTLAGVIHEAHLFHAYVRGTQSWVEIKGGNPLTENYSVLGPEVILPQNKAEKNHKFVEKLLVASRLVIAGQAASHCVKSTIDDLLSEILARDPELAKKVYILEDCTSAVAVPDGAGGFAVDFTPQAEAAFDRYRDAGMHLVRSTDPIDSWPDFLTN